MSNHRPSVRTRLGVGLTAALCGVGVHAAPTASADVPSAPPDSEVVYDALPSPMPANVASLGFEATGTGALGDRIHLIADGQILDSVTVTMSDWAPRSSWAGDPRYPDEAHWTHPVTVTVYGDTVDASGVPDAPLATTTQDVTIPWRPEASNDCGAGWKAADGACYHGIAFDAVFDFSGSGVALPSDVVVAVSFDTESYGGHPLGEAGPYNSLNVGVPTNQTVTVGEDASTDEVFWDSTYAGRVAGLRSDLGWVPNGTVALQVGVVDPDCATAIQTDERRMTLTRSCRTEHTLTVPDGFAFDGAGYTVTAVDPPGGHFEGAVLAADGSSAQVTDVTVTAHELSDGCDSGVARLAGILFDGASGSITGSRVIDIRQGTHSGCQEGNAIRLQNSSGEPAQVEVTGNTVTGYQKNGITVTGPVAATITGNTVTGDGPVDYIAQNGVQVSNGATALVRDNTVTGNDYIPQAWTACGLLYYQAAGVKAGQNVLDGNERNVCNAGRGGGTYQP